MTGVSNAKNASLKAYQRSRQGAACVLAYPFMRQTHEDHSMKANPMMSPGTAPAAKRALTLVCVSPA